MEFNSLIWKYFTDNDFDSHVCKKNKLNSLIKKSVVLWMNLRTPNGTNPIFIICYTNSKLDYSNKFSLLNRKMSLVNFGFIKMHYKKNRMLLLNI